MDNSISIPNSLVLRSLPVNVELVDLIQSKRRGKSPSQIEKISSCNSPGPQPAPASMPLLHSEKPQSEVKKNKTMIKKKQKAPSFDDKVFSDEPHIK